MRLPFSRLAALAVLAITAGPAPAVIMKLTHLGELLDSEDYIFVASVDKVDPDKPSAVFKVEKKLKGDPPYERIPVNMTGNDEAKKAGDTKTILDRLDGSRKVIFFVGKRGKNHNVKAFVEGSWFSVHGTEDPADKVVRWAFLSGEPFLRRTFKGTSPELVKVIEDGLAKKAKPPAADDKEKPGYGPPVEKKCGECSERTRSVSDGVGSCLVPLPLRERVAALRGRVRGGTSWREEVSPLTRDLRSPPSPARGEGKTNNHPVAHAPGSPALFAVIPSFVLVGPLAVIAALFPGVFAKMAVGMKKWRAFLVVASVNSTLALVYWLLATYRPSAIPGGWAFGPTAFTLYLTIIAAVGLSWAGRRYRRMAAEEPNVTNTPTRTELYALAGLTAFAAVSALLVAWFADWRWRTNLELPLREFTFIGISLAAAGLYAGYRFLTRHVDHGTQGAAPERRLSLSGESVGLAVLVLCGFTMLVSGGRAPVATGTEGGDADPIGPRYVGVKAFEVKKSSQVMSGITVAGDRLYFGAQLTRATAEGQLVCLDRETGEEKWRFEADDDLKPVFCTPTVIDGKVYCGEGLHTDKDCRMFCVDAATGKPAWDQAIKTGSHTEGAPAVAGGKLFFPAGDDGLIAVDAKTREQRWQFKGGKDAGIHIDAAPAVGGDRVFVGSGLYTFVAACLDADTGKELWRTDLKLRSFGAPLAAGKFVYYGVGTGNMGEDVFNYPEEGESKEKEPAGAVVCLDAGTGKEVWRFDLPRSVHTGLAGDAFTVYATSRDGFVYALDRKTGKLRWKTGIGGAVTSAPAVATGGGLPVAVYAVSREGLAVCLNPHTGRVVWKEQLPGYTYSPGNDVLSGPTVVTSPTATGSKRAIYVGAMTVDPDNPAKKTCAVFRFDDEIGGE